MTIKYLKGSDNKVADALSRIETRLDPETVTELLNHARKMREWIRRSSSVLPSWLVKIRNFIISVQKTGGKPNEWTR